MELSGKNIVVTGGGGFLGQHFVKELRHAGVGQRNIFVPRSKDIDLRKKESCLKVTTGVDIVIHLAGNVGGIGKNQNQPADLFYDNILMGAHLIDAAMRNRVKKLVLIGTICAYPKFTPVPFREENLWLGYPEETNAPYGLAKKMLLVGADAYRSQYGLKSIYLLLVNLYGPGDNFNPQSSHVIPSLIVKFYNAKKRTLPSITVWGDGSPTREFLYVEDAARAIVLAAKLYDKPDPVNIGSGKEISIKDLAILIARLTKYQGSIQWDASKPNGQPRRLLDTSRAKKAFGFVAKTKFIDGLTKTIQWYEQTQNKK